MSTTKFAIGCLVQWYECDIIKQYIDTLKQALENYKGPSVQVDIHISVNEYLEKCTSPEQKRKCIEKIREVIGFNRPANWALIENSDLVTIADYRRQFNEYYCDKVDVLVWGESDMLVPKQMFTLLDLLHRNVGNNTPKYLATFASCKMWDDSWKPLEHPQFTVKAHSDSAKDWWGVRYVMTAEEMNKFNDQVTDVELKVISPHKFNGCGLVISSEVIKAGVNIPKSIFFVHEDTALMVMTQKVLGNIPQYHFGNILLVHNRKDPKKRSHIQGEEGMDKANIGALRKSHPWYSKANKLCEENCYNLFNPNHKSNTWDDVWK